MDPTLAMCAALVDGTGLSSFVGGPFDVRAVVAGIRPEAKDGFLLDEVPWEHFPQGDHVREAVHLLYTGTPRHTCTGVVGGMCADDMRAAAVPSATERLPAASCTIRPASPGARRPSGP
ncbi:hypothetical protein [Streptomyces yangpuensis]|uniref:hypothetical protein n=1 Tax=Streptomyces yangpuensis TaxID=1648182 RepID=UPI00364D42A5